MYTLAYDKGRNLVVTLFSGPANTYRDFERAAADVVAADANAAGSADGVLHLTEIEPGNPPPDARCRKLLQDAVSRSTCAPRYVVCFITASAVVRCILTALAWFRPANAPHVTRAFAHFEDALAFAETQRPGVGARLLELRGEARARTDQTPVAAAAK